MNEKKVALVIGGTGGIGHAITKLFLEQRVRVYATYYKNQAKAKNMEKISKECRMVKCDIRKGEDVKEIVEHIEDNEPRLDIVVNASTSNLKLKPFESLTLDEFSDDINVILMGSINVFKHVVPVMKKNRSGIIIVLLTSTIVNGPPIRMSSYVTAKSGLLGLMRSVAKEVEQFNIRVLGISPSFVETELIKAFPSKLLEIEKEKQPEMTFIQPEDIAGMVMKLVADCKRYPNGENTVLNTRRDVLK